MLKGAAMGAADAVPGVSGGTIALITGVYERFIAALASFKPSLVGYLIRKDLAGLWRAIDGTFLLSLGSGILISMFTALNVMHWLLVTVEPLVWAFFMGVIIASIYFLALDKEWHLKDFVLLCLGLILSLGLILGGNQLIVAGYALAATPAILIFGGALAISAMLLPGISGSFMLLLLGLYPVIVEAVHERNLIIVMWVAIGCVIGVLGFSRFLQWLLERWHHQVITFMLGFVVGALVKVWPWQADGLWYFPNNYTAVTGQANLWLFSIAVVIVGALLVVLMHKLSKK